MDDQEREKSLIGHFQFMSKCLEVAQEALENKEVPVACIYVYRGEIIARAYNQTNVTLNGTKHAEFEGFDKIKAMFPDTYLEVLRETDLYVTVEPCIMCASMLRQIKIRRCFFGCANERFGGNGSVFKINRDYPKVGNLIKDKLPKPYLSYPGILYKEAIVMLRKFYIMDNENSPTPRDKTERKLELKEYPSLDYSLYLTREEFVQMFGECRGEVYDCNGEIEVDSFTNNEKHLLVDDPAFHLKKQKKL